MNTPDIDEAITALRKTKNEEMEKLAEALKEIRAALLDLETRVEDSS